MKRIVALVLALLCLLPAALAEESWTFDRDGLHWGMPVEEALQLTGMTQEDVMPLGYDVMTGQPAVTDVQLEALLQPDGSIYGHDADVNCVFVNGVLTMYLYDAPLGEAAAQDVRGQLAAEYGEPMNEGDRLYSIMNVLVHGLYTPGSFAAADCWELPDGTLLYFVNYGADIELGAPSDMHVVCWIDYENMINGLGLTGE